MKKSSSKSNFIKKLQQDPLQAVIAVAFILGFAGFGVYQLRGSSAATLSTALYGRNDASSVNTGPGVTIVDDSIGLPSGAFLGNVRVINAIPGGHVNFGGRGAAPPAGTPTQKSGRTCYVARAVGEATQIEITHIGAGGKVYTKVVNLKKAPTAYASAYWQYVCADSSDTLVSPAPEYVFRNVGTSDARVYEVQYLQEYGY